MSGRQLPIILALGTTQTLAWASSYYLPAILADPIARDLGVSSNWVFARLLGLAGAVRPARPAHRAPDRSGRRPVGAVDVQSGAGGGTGAARLRDLDPRAGAGLAAARHRHGRGPVRCGLCRARAHLWRRGAPVDHRHHADRGLCLDRRMAADRVGPGNHRLAQHLLCLGGGAYPDRPAAQFVDAAGRHRREGGGREPRSSRISRSIEP